MRSDGLKISLLVLSLGGLIGGIAPGVLAQGGQKDMGSMMQDCQARHQAMSTTIQQTLDTVTKAKDSNDPAQMRAALSAAQQSLAAMQSDMAPCDRMMDMMQMMKQMPGNSGGQSK